MLVAWSKKNRMQQAPFTLHSAIVFTLFCILPVGNGRSKKLKGVSTKSTTVKWAEALKHLVNPIISPLTKSLKKFLQIWHFLTWEHTVYPYPPFPPPFAKWHPFTEKTVRPSRFQPRLSNGFRGSSSTPTQGPAANFVTLRNVGVTVRVKPRGGETFFPPKPNKKQKRGRKRPWNSNIKSDPKERFAVIFFRWWL